MILHLRAGNQSRSSARVSSALNGLAISPAQKGSNFSIFGGIKLICSASCQIEIIISLFFFPSLKDLIR